MYKKLKNGINLFIITKAGWKPMLDMDGGCGHQVDSVLIERSIYNKVHEHKEIWAMLKMVIIPNGKIEIF